MQYELDKLIELISLEKIERNLFQGYCQGGAGERIYGGMVLAQALMAAGRTVSIERIAHSLHAYFIRPGSYGDPIVYQVERTRDGTSFSTRRVVAIQNQQPIFNLSASFQIQEAGEEHQFEMPHVPSPEALEDQYDVLMRDIDEIPLRYRQRVGSRYPIRLRLTCLESPLSRAPKSNTTSLWMKAEGQIKEGLLTHQALLAYASDYRLLATSLRPHGRVMFDDRTMVASLDHALWIHRPFRMDEWLLYTFDTPSASNARGFSRGSIFSREGVLIASVAQEGLIRPLD